MLVVATTAADLATTRARLDDLGVRIVQIVAPGGDRRVVVLAAVDDQWEAERLATMLRSEGAAAVNRPDGGARLEQWTRHTRPVSFGDRLSVCFAWSEHDRAGLCNLVELGPGGFGNGEHPATRLLVEELVCRISGGERVLDVGCGSGVLGLCALRLGAAHLVAMDIEPAAVEATRRNAVINGMAGRVEATIAPLGEIEGTFDVVLANVGRGVVVDVAPDLVRLLAPGGWLAVSGISPAQCSLVAGFLRPLVAIGGRDSGEWASLLLAGPAPTYRGSVTKGVTDE